MNTTQYQIETVDIDGLVILHRFARYGDYFWAYWAFMSNPKIKMVLVP